MGKHDWSGLRLLVLDRHAHMRSILKTVLREFGVGQVQEAAKVTAGLEILQCGVTDIVILDHALGEGSGLEFIRQVRTGPGVPNPFVPIIVLSAHSDREQVFAVRDAGANEFLAKPLVPLHLFRRLQLVIEAPRPFVRAKSYFGPDRRRKAADLPGGQERRQEEVWAA